MEERAANIEEEDSINVDNPTCHAVTLCSLVENLPSLYLSNVRGYEVPQDHLNNHWLKVVMGFNI